MPLFSLFCCMYHMRQYTIFSIYPFFTRSVSNLFNLFQCLFVPLLVTLPGPSWLPGWIHTPLCSSPPPSPSATWLLNTLRSLSFLTTVSTLHLHSGTLSPFAPSLPPRFPGRCTGITPPPQQRPWIDCCPTRPWLPFRPGTHTWRLRLPAFTSSPNPQRS